MKIIKDVPDPIYNAIQWQDSLYADSHQQHSDISVTTLLKPPQMVQLEQKYDDQLEQNASEMMFMLMGNVTHTILENAANEGDVIEERFYRECQGWTVSGMVDRYVPELRLLQDYKVMSVWEIIFGIKEEKAAQLNILAWLMDAPVERLEIVGILRDWQKSKVNDSGYSKAPCVTVEVDVWTPEQTEEYVAARIEQHKAARMGVRVPCSDEERWYTGTKYAVMKGNNKRAVKLCESSAQAFAMAQKDKQLWVQTRPGISKRCAGYCAVGKAGLCRQWNDEQSA